MFVNHFLTARQRGKMKYWEVIADKLSGARLVVGLLQRRYA
jgi:hypothetical protein